MFMSERHELLFHAHPQFSNTIRYGSCTNFQQRLLAAIRFIRVVCVSLLYLSNAFIRRGSVFVFLIIKFIRQSTSYFFKVG